MYRGSDPADRAPPDPLRIERIHVPLDTVGDLLRLGVGPATGPGVAHLAAAVVPDVAVQAVDHDALGLAGERGQRLREELVAGGCVQDLRGDRKSTRLNSSHVKISYAVFCL